MSLIFKQLHHGDNPPCAIIRDGKPIGIASEGICGWTVYNTFGDGIGSSWHTREQLTDAVNENYKGEYDGL